MHAFIKALQKLVAMHYPESAGKMIISNAPLGFHTAWKIISQFLDASFAKKFDIMSGPAHIDIDPELPWETQWYLDARKKWTLPELWEQVHESDKSPSSGKMTRVLGEHVPNAWGPKPCHYGCRSKNETEQLLERDSSSFWSEPDAWVKVSGDDTNAPPQFQQWAGLQHKIWREHGKTLVIRGGVLLSEVDLPQKLAEVLRKALRAEEFPGENIETADRVEAAVRGLQMLFGVAQAKSLILQGLRGLTMSDDSREIRGDCADELSRLFERVLPVLDNLDSSDSSDPNDNWNWNKDGEGVICL